MILELMPVSKLIARRENLVARKVTKQLRARKGKEIERWKIGKSRFPQIKKMKTESHAKSQSR